MKINDKQLDEWNPTYADLRKQYKIYLDLPWGFEVGSGWLELITKLIEDIIETKPSKNFSIVQVKEKFGGLRVYTRHGKEEIYNLIDIAEKKSYEVCETCGDTGTLRRDSWYNVSCDLCHAKRKKK